MDVTGRQVFQSDRADRRLLATAGVVHHQLQALRPQLAFDPRMGRRTFDGWRERVRSRLRRLLAFPKIAAQPRPKKVASDSRDGYTLEKWELYPMSRCVMPVLMLIPDGVVARHPAPAVLCIPGSGSTKETLAGETPHRDDPDSNRYHRDNWMARHYAQAGLVAVAIDHAMVGELHSDIRPNREAICRHLNWMGWSYEGLDAFQAYCTLKWLKARSFVRQRCVGVSGHSLGAKPALHLAVLDPMVRALVWNDYVSDWRQQQAAINLSPLPEWHYIPGFIRWFDYTDLMASLAPRPMLITEGGRTRDIQNVRRAYRLLRSAPHLKVCYHKGYESSAQRPNDRRSLPEGLSYTEYLTQYANVDVKQHVFHRDVAVPWLVGQLTK